MVERLVQEVDVERRLIGLIPALSLLSEERKAIFRGLRV